MDVVLKVCSCVGDTFDTPLWKAYGSNKFLDVASVHLPMSHNAFSVKTQLFVFSLSNTEPAFQNFSTIQ